MTVSVTNDDGLLNFNTTFLSVYSTKIPNNSNNIVILNNDDDLLLYELAVVHVVVFNVVDDDEEGFDAGQFPAFLI